MPGGEAEQLRRKKAIIAVFGPSQHEKAKPVETLSTEIGSAIAERNQILLTGGTGCKDKGVKGMAICGALRARPLAALWIGVTQKPSEVKWVPVLEGIAGVIRTDLGTVGTVSRRTFVTVLSPSQGLRERIRRPSSP